MIFGNFVEYKLSVLPAVTTELFKGKKLVRKGVRERRVGDFDA